MEIVICPCLEDHTIHGSISCLNCHREILTKVELTKLHVKLCQQAIDLRVAIFKLETELLHRKEYKPATQILSKRDFFVGVKKSPQGSHTPKVDPQTKAEALLRQFSYLSKQPS